MNGFIHSTESFGTVDGPGVCFVIFLQGCPMRCLYCHNPDTWELGAGTEMTCGQLLDMFEKNRVFYKNGGITCTGGEPMLQSEFVTELFGEAHARGINTCLDTSGICFTPEDTSSADALLSVTDLVMLDIKHIDDDIHRKLTGRSNRNILDRPLLRRNDLSGIILVSILYREDRAVVVVCDLEACRQRTHAREDF
ncbi:MAG: radical SAM protein, partial [Ruminiclostridium sp.]|nr:radical SAM protein [Ruminiclostridium sp.]